MADAWGGGGAQITIPADPPAPASMEFRKVRIAAVAENPFTGQQQVQDWQAEYMAGSVSLPPLTRAQAADWVAFLEDLQGVVNVFQFGAAFAAAYPETLMAGSPPAQRYWRLKSNESSWRVEADRYTRITFEVREAL